MSRVCPDHGADNMIGIEYEYTHAQYYDGISEWMCMTCKRRWGRWTGHELKTCQFEPRYGILKTGTIVKVFDCHAWREAGGDVGDNECFRKWAVVKECYRDKSDLLVDVLFGESCRHSKGHFVRSVEVYA